MSTPFIVLIEGAIGLLDRARDNINDTGKGCHTMRRPMFALTLILSALPYVAQSAQDNDPAQTRVHDDATVELERIRALLEKLRQDCADAGVDRCTDAGPSENEP